MWLWRPRPATRPAASYFARTFILDTVVTRRGSRCSFPYIRASAAEALPAPVVHLRASILGSSIACRALQVGARSGNRSDGRLPSILFRENTNLEWMVLVSRKRTPPVESIFRAGLRVRTGCAASTQRAATTPRRSPPPRRRSEVC